MKSKYTSKSKYSYKKKYNKKYSTVEKKLKRFDRLIERKYSNNTYSSTVGTTLGVTISANLIAQGTASSQRVGNKITIKSLLLRYVCFQSGNTDDYALMRVIVVKDLNQIADTFPSASDILTDPTNITSCYAKTTAPKRIKVLYDKVIDVNATAIAYNTNSNSTIVYNPARHKEIYIFPKCDVYFNGSANTDVQKNGIWVYCMSSGSGISNIFMTCQTCYEDL